MDSSRPLKPPPRKPVSSPQLSGLFSHEQLCF